jgi:hypothetical protein
MPLPMEILAPCEWEGTPNCLQPKSYICDLKILDITVLLQCQSATYHTHFTQTNPCTLPYTPNMFVCQQPLPPSERLKKVWGNLIQFINDFKNTYLFDSKEFNYCQIILKNSSVKFVFHRDWDR